ncbi:hypothetical protein [Paenibacillus sp. WLX2291]|uniref:hypothetical protein n=1 Tax=Paenibacillus sp. WLX2291 TaxID=3296934 RepID=UPI0039840ABE
MNLKCISLENSKSISQSVCSYIPEVQTFNVITEYMSDECIPYRLSMGACVWLTATGVLGEIELIYPLQLSEHILWKRNHTSKQKGHPYFQDLEYEYENVVVEVAENQFIIWLDTQSVIDLEITANNLMYLFSKNRLVGLYAKGYKIIAYESKH